MPHLRLLSDLHFEFEEPAETVEFVDSLAFEDYDTCVLAGDIVTPDTADRLRILCERWPTVEFHHTPGNHEYYGARIATMRERLNLLEMQLDNYRLLDRKVHATVGSSTLAGATMWYVPPSTPEESRLLTSWSDWRHILNPIDVFYEAGQDRQFLNNVRKFPDTVFVTHMLPHAECVASPWKGAPTNVFFLNETVWCDRLVQGKGLPKLWLFGHTHDSIDVEVKGTRFVCNPRGYAPDRFNPNFDPHLKLEI